MNCSHELLHSFNNTESACKYLEACGFEYDYFSLLELNYCKFENRQYITWPLIVLVFLLCFFFLSTSVDEYVSRILGRMSIKLNMSQNLAGLTLLALGNQSVDIIVALVSGDEDNGGIPASLSTILGADSLVIGFVMPTVIFLGKGVSVKGQNFIRDLLTYLIGLSIIVLIGTIMKKINIIFGFIIFILYILYVGLCILMENIENRKIAERERLKKEGNSIDDNESIEHDEHHQFKVKLLVNKEERERLYNDSKTSFFENSNISNDVQNKGEEKNLNNLKISDIKNLDHNSEENNSEDNDLNKNMMIEFKTKLENEDQEELETQEPDEKKCEKGEKTEKEVKEEKDKEKEEDGEHDIIDILTDKMGLMEGVASLKGSKVFNINEFINDNYYLEQSRLSITLNRQSTNILTTDNNLMYNRLHFTLAKYYLNSKEEKWEDLSFLKKIIKILVEFPMNIIRDLTTPPFEKEKWKKEFFALSPISISLCLSLFFNLFPYYIKYPFYIGISIYYFILIILAIYLYRKTYRGALPNCEWVLLISALIMSMIWIYTVTTILVQMVNDSQFLLPFEISKSFLIMTVLAIGNALPDYLIDCTLSKRGYAEMALSGTIGSPVFSLLFGFGLALIKYFTLSDKKEEDFDLLSPSNRVILCAIGGIFVNLIHYMIVFSCSKFKVKKGASYAGFCFFFGYLTSIVLVSFVFNFSEEN